MNCFKRNLLPFTLLVALTVIHPAEARQSNLIAEGAELTLQSARFTFTEGPATDSEGNIYFTDQPDNKIWKYSTGGELSLFMENAGRSNGMYFDNDGHLLTCADEKNEIWSISPEGEVSVLVASFKEQRLNGPNDLWVHPDGGIYFTDPYYQREYWSHNEKEIDEERVYYITPDRSEIRIAADGLVRPNGIIGTPDGKTLYVADIDDRKTYSYTILPDGSLTDRKLFAEPGSDGMTIDEQGNIYLTGDGVLVFDSSGRQIEHIEVPENWTANVTFGGADRKTLFVTAMSGIYTLRMNVKGVR